MNWDDVKHFKPSEFDSPDAPGSGEENMKVTFIQKLDLVREKLGFPLVVNSGYRTPKHNEKVGGVESSAHVRGYAADLSIPDNSSRNRYEMLYTFMDYGFNRIGIANSYIHVDDDPQKVEDVVWVY